MRVSLRQLSAAPGPIDSVPLGCSSERMTREVSPHWLPADKRAAVCFTIDDVHPGKSTDAYEAGGDLGCGALGHLEWLLARHPSLRATLFVTADWREISALPTRLLLARVPVVRSLAYLTPVLPAGTMRLSRHPEFVQYVRSLPRTDIGLHGLHHVHRGPRVPVEFQDEDAAECRRRLVAAQNIFEGAGLPYVMGMTPPGWNLPEGLGQAMVDLSFRFVASARDVQTPISPTATTNMSGMKGVSLVFPERIRNGRLVHITSNFQATSPLDRAMEVVGVGGLLAVKAHIIKMAFGYMQLDGLDELYRNYLDVVFSRLEDHFGDSLWWTTMDEVSERVLGLVANGGEHGGC